MASAPTIVGASAETVHIPEPEEPPFSVRNYDSEAWLPYGNYRYNWIGWKGTPFSSLLYGQWLAIPFLPNLPRLYSATPGCFNAYKPGDKFDIDPQWYQMPIEEHTSREEELLECRKALIFLLHMIEYKDHFFHPERTSPGDKWSYSLDPDSEFAEQFNRAHTERLSRMRSVEDDQRRAMAMFAPWMARVEKLVGL